MEHLGSGYAVVLRDPQLRQVMIADATRSAEHSRSKASRRLQLVHCLHWVSFHIERRFGPQSRLASISRICPNGVCRELDPFERFSRELSRSFESHPESIKSTTWEELDNACSTSAAGANRDARN